jgi:hypothetical protein
VGYHEQFGQCLPFGSAAWDAHLVTEKALTIPKAPAGALGMLTGYINGVFTSTKSLVAGMLHGCTPDDTYFSDKLNTCLNCDDLEVCAIGQYRLGCGGGDGTDTGDCDPCTVSIPHSHHVSAGAIHGDAKSCAQDCDDGYHEHFGRCFASCKPDKTYLSYKMDECRDCDDLTVCGFGQYRLGCGGGVLQKDKGNCVACSEPVKHSHHTSAGGVHGDADSCSFTCDVGYHDHYGQCVLLNSESRVHRPLWGLAVTKPGGRMD